MNHTTKLLLLSSATRSSDEADGDVEGHHLEAVPGDQSGAMALFRFCGLWALGETLKGASGHLRRGAIHRFQASSLKVDCFSRRKKAP